MKEEHIGPTSNPPNVTVVTSASGDVLLSSFQNIGMKKKASAERSIAQRVEKKLLK